MTQARFSEPRGSAPQFSANAVDENAADKPTNAKPILSVVITGLVSISAGPNGCILARRDNLIPLSFLDSRIVDQYEIQVAAREIASVVPVFALAKARHYEEPSCRTQNALQFRSWIK
jgi:hypothetical protein